jgi:hypothetical protein
MVSMRICLVIALAMIVGCGGDDDCCEIKTPDAAIDGPQLPATHHHYVIDKVTVPQSNTQARDLGLDLNGDQTIDNQLGMVLSTFASMGLDPQVEMDKLIDTGAGIMLGDLGADDLTNESFATFTIYQGANPMPAACAGSTDTVCRKHLTGSAAFSIKAGAPIDPPLTGAIVNSKLVAGPGHLTLQLVFAGSMPFTVTLLGARVDLTNTATSSSGKLGGAVTKTDLDTKIIPAMRAGFQVAVMRDCTMLTSPPSCGCVQDSSGKTLLGLFDTSPKDCSISVAEVQNNSLIVSLLAPDVTVEGMQALSIGLGVHAVGGTFTAPM